MPNAYCLMPVPCPYISFDNEKLWDYNAIIRKYTHESQGETTFCAMGGQYMTMQFCFWAAVAVTLLGGALAIRYRKTSRVWMVILTISMFVALFMLIVPFVPSDIQLENAASTAGAPSDQSQLSPLRYVSYMLVSAMKLFTLDGDYSEGIVPLGRSAAGSLPWFYSGLFSLLYVLAPLLGLGILASFSQKLTAHVRWVFSFGKETWFFSTPSPKALMLAKDVLAKEPPRRHKPKIEGSRLSEGEKAKLRKERELEERQEEAEKAERARRRRDRIRVVFCSVKEDDYAAVNEIGAIPLEQSIGKLSRRYLNRRFSSVLFMSDDEARNMDDTLEFIRMHPEEKGKPILVYTFTTRPEADLLLNAASIGPRIKCRRIAENRALVYQELLQDDDLLTGVDINQGLHLVVFGCGWVGEELVKALLWNTVREIRDEHGNISHVDLKVAEKWRGPGKELLPVRRVPVWIDIVDTREVRDEFFQKYPGLRPYEHTEPYQPYGSAEEASLASLLGPSIRFIENANIRTLDLAQLGDPLGISHIFMALGKESDNLECALRLRQVIRALRVTDCRSPEKRLKAQWWEKDERGRDEIRESALSLPHIHIVMDDPANAKLDFRDRKNKPFGIKPFGGKGYYTVETLLNYRLERRALLEHLGWDLRGVEDTMMNAGETREKREAARESCARIIAFIRNELKKPGPNDMRKPSDALHWSEEEFSYSDWRAVLSSDLTKGFYQYDYNSASSRARAAFDLCRKELAHDNEIEHVRWNLFMLTEGYHNDESGRIGYKNTEGYTDVMALQHRDIARFDQLDAWSRNKDEEIEVTIARALEKMKIYDEENGKTA